MEQLTDGQMKAAYFARMTDMMAIDFDGDGEAAATATSLTEEERQVDLARYRAGKEVLKRYTLNVEGRGTVPHVLMPPDGAVGCIVVEAGWVGTAQAYALSVFRVRPEKARA